MPIFFFILLFYVTQKNFFGQLLKIFLR